jgi:hypothetical protein
VVKRSFYDSELGLQVPFAIQIDEQLPCGFGRIDQDLHRFARLIDQLSAVIKRFNSKPVSPIALGLELELTLLAIGFRDALPCLTGVL